MSTSIKMNSFKLTTDAQNVSEVLIAKNTGLNLSGTGGQNQNNSVDTILNISKEARLKLKNHPGNTNAFKKAGVTSARDRFEDDALDTRNYMRGVNQGISYTGELLEEWMRQDEPETYAKCKALWSQFAESGARYYGEEGFEYFEEECKLRYDWFCRRCFDDEGYLKNPVTGGRLLVSSLEARYSDAVHDTSVDVYDDSFSEEDQSPFRFGTKFNVLMPVELLRDLEMIQNLDALSEKEKEEVGRKLQKIDDAVNNMKEIEKNYEGNLQSLRFAVKFDKGGNATYYADYAFCEEEDGISAKTAEELLEKLMSK